MKTRKCWNCNGKGYNILENDDLITVYSYGLNTKTMSLKEYEKELINGKDITCSVNPFSRESWCSYCEGRGYFIDLEEGD